LGAFEVLDNPLFVDDATVGEVLVTCCLPKSFSVAFFDVSLVVVVVVVVIVLEGVRMGGVVIAALMTNTIIRTGRLESSLTECLLKTAGHHAVGHRHRGTRGRRYRAIRNLRYRAIRNLRYRAIRGRRYRAIRGSRYRASRDLCYRAIRGRFTVETVQTHQNKG
jgi:hypothetical protein